MTPTDNPRERIDLIGHMLRVLTAATALRDERPGWNDSTGECDWMTFERQVMLTEVNGARAICGLTPVHEDEVRRADRQAEGRDWDRKFALYCAELALGVDPQP